MLSLIYCIYSLWFILDNNLFSITKIRLITNNPYKTIALREYGIDIIDTVLIEMQPNADNRSYLETKKNKMGHLLHVM